MGYNGEQIDQLICTLCGTYRMNRHLVLCRGMWNTGNCHCACELTLSLIVVSCTFVSFYLFVESDMWLCIVYMFLLVWFVQQYGYIGDQNCLQQQLLSTHYVNISFISLYIVCHRLHISTGILVKCLVLTNQASLYRIIN